MKQALKFLFIFVSVIISAQDLKYSDQEIQKKLDSIKAEGNTLFSYEKASWQAGDLMAKNKKLNGNIGIYLTYKVSDTTKTVFLNKDQTSILAEYSFKNNQTNTSKESLIQRELNETEKKLKNIRAAIIPQLSNPQYGITVPQGYNLNLVIIPFNENYKVYLIPGTSQSGIIPFGNDYLFISDSKGDIISNQKFHSRLIPTMTSMENGGTVTMSTHSHLRTTPFISATDICTFKLYAPLTKLDEFSVYSPALGIYMKYNYKKDTIEKGEKL